MYNILLIAHLNIKYYKYKIIKTDIRTLINFKNIYEIQNMKKRLYLILN